MLQVGGVQDAVMVAAPGCEVVAAQVVPAAHPAVAVPATSAAGAEETHVSGGLGTMQPCTSTAVAVMVSDVPLFTTKFEEVCVPFTPSPRAMHCTGQVSIS